VVRTLVLAGELSLFCTSLLAAVKPSAIGQPTCDIFPFSALTLLVGRQEGQERHLACKKTVCWWWWFDWSFARLV